MPDFVDWAALLSIFVAAILTGPAMGRGALGFLYMFTILTGVYVAVRYWRGVI